MANNCNSILLATNKSYIVTLKLMTRVKTLRHFHPILMTRLCTSFIFGHSKMPC